MSQKKLVNELMGIYLNLFNDASYTKQEAAIDLLQVIKIVEENGVEVNECDG